MGRAEIGCAQRQYALGCEAVDELRGFGCIEALGVVGSTLDHAPPALRMAMATFMKQINTNRFLYDQMHPYVQGKKTLDIGCGDGAYSSISDDTTRLDKNGSVDPDIAIDLESADLPFKSRDFACVLMLDVLQHLTRERGERALRQAKSATSGRIYVLVPMWNDPKEHQSSWSPDDFKGWARIEFGNYFFGYWDYDPNEVVEAEEPAPQKENPKSAKEPAPQKVDPKGAEIRSPFGYKTDWDY